MRRSVAIVGSEGRIGGLVMGMADSDWRILGITRMLDPVGLDRPVDRDRLPILVCTRNDHLPEALAGVHHRHPDLVFVQNGMVQPFLAEQGSGCTQGVLWVAVPRRGDSPVPGGRSVFHGPWAKPIAALFDGMASMPQRSTARPGGRLRSNSRGSVCSECWALHSGERWARSSRGTRGRRALSDELHPLLVQEPGLDLDAAGLRAASRPTRSGFRTSLSIKEWRWRNGWQRDAGARLGIAQPVFEEWLARAGGPPA